MNIKEIQLEVFKLTGKGIDPDDPFFVALAMLSVTAKEIDKKNDSALNEMRLAVESVNNSKIYLREQNEKLLIDQVKQIKLSVSQLTSLENNMSAAVVNQARTQLVPVLASIEVVAKRLMEKDGIALEQLRKTSETQKTWSRTAQYFVCGFILSSLMAGLGGYYVGNVVASKDVVANAEWLSSEDGKYALQLRDARSLKQLATCNPGEVSNGWKIKDEKSCIPTPLKTKDGYLSTGWKIKP